MDVLDPQDERLLLPQPLEQREQRLEQLCLGELGAGRRARAVAQLREQRPELPACGGRQLVQDGVAVTGEPAQESDDRGVRQLLAAELHAVPAFHAGPALAGLGREGAEQA